jgi:hypothetical protein
MEEGVGMSRAMFWARRAAPPEANSRAPAPRFALLLPLSPLNLIFPYPDPVLRLVDQFLELAGDQAEGGGGEHWGGRGRGYMREEEV